MKLKSLIQNRNRLEIADVEIEFIPGIPQIHFLGLPDRQIKESFYRIKSALKNSGYKFPVTSQMIVNIKPNHLRKSSRGVELAVALGLLLKTEQIAPDSLSPDWIIYGELGLDGTVYEPTDLGGELTYFKNETFLSGRKSETSQSSLNRIFRLSQIKDFEISTNENELCENFFTRPKEGLERFYSEDEAEFIFLTATSQSHALLAGDSGAGKSTLARSLLSFLPVPTDTEVGRWHQAWRPLVAPHPSITPAAFLGGGQNLYEGEVERVQGGLLLMDEFLEYDPEILESLRGPMTGEKLRLARGSANREIESNFRVIATTNLCPCGKWTPLKKNLSCRYSRLRCTRYLEKLSGPILDRFGLLFFTAPVRERKISGYKVYERIEAMNKLLSFEKIFKTNAVISTFYADLTARRRDQLEKLARLYALERYSEKNTSEVTLTFDDYNRAEKWVTIPFQQLEKGMS
ncbi:MAG: ATP-binding protein [Bdellovibrionaceae bacterium]|nr:ATP-binding protein [Bdellovibrio sp.]